MDRNSIIIIIPDDNLEYGYNNIAENIICTVEHL
jgi:hypothetical protein